MNVTTINYDLHAPGRDYQPLYEAIKALGNWAHVLESCWVVRTQLSATQVRDRLKQHVDANDSLFVFASVFDWASWNIKPEVVEWLKAA